jgi:uncharacterized protein (TIGR02996 family)
MMHPPRFLEHILQRPSDDLPRLRYANWLDGCGNPLGEFIRLQCLLAHNTAGATSLRHERRAQQLLATFECEWSRSLNDRVRWCSFRRGFIEEISITDRVLIKHARALFHTAPVLDIHLQSDGKRLHELPEVPDIPYTFFLDLSAQGLGDESIEGLADAPMLTHVHGLNLASTYLGDDGLEALAFAPNLTNLRELYLNDNPIGDDGIRRFVMSNLVDRLDVVDVCETEVSEEGIETLRRVLGDKVRC